MRALDPRLLERTRSARPLLALDTVLGIGTALAVLAQASLLEMLIGQLYLVTAISVMIGHYVSRRK